MKDKIMMLRIKQKETCFTSRKQDKLFTVITVVYFVFIGFVYHHFPLLFYFTFSAILAPDLLTVG